MRVAQEHRAWHSAPGAWDSSTRRSGFPRMFGVGIFVGSDNFCSAKRRMDTPSPELCVGVAHWTSILGEERRLPTEESVEPNERD